MVVIALELVLAVVILGAVVWAGDVVGEGIEAALGDKPIRDRDG